jgi:hypothetical protein
METPQIRIIVEYFSSQSMQQNNSKSVTYSLLSKTLKTPKAIRDIIITSPTSRDSYSKRYHSFQSAYQKLEI